MRVHTRVYKQDGTLVAEFKRAVLVPRKNRGLRGSAPRQAHGPDRRGFPLRPAAAQPTPTRRIEPVIDQRRGASGEFSQPSATDAGDLRRPARSAWRATARRTWRKRRASRDRRRARSWYALQLAARTGAGGALEAPGGLAAAQADLRAREVEALDHRLIGGSGLGGRPRRRRPSSGKPRGNMDCYVSPRRQAHSLSKAYGVS